ncbi:MAG: type VI secretion system protein TssL [Limnobacter sp.]|nr:type VI secretion system protein TssL [Limnobacter sp.]
MISDQARVLRELLSAEIARDVVRVDDYLSHTEIVLPSAVLFESGSARIHDSFTPVLDKIARALERIKGDVQVEGHTDNQPINDLRYPSNWHLSLARAAEVVRYMGDVPGLERRLLPYGRGALEPVASNDTPAQRALNRRVVMKILHPVDTSSSALGGLEPLP